MKPTLAIIGRPNVGKSTLFNRIVGSRKALTLNSPGVTRDRNFALADWQGRAFLCVDTGGFPVNEGTLDEKVNDQIELAIDESDAILCLLDGEAGLIPEEERIVAQLRKVNKPVYYVVNKVDVPKHEDRLSDFSRLGVPALYPISAEHGYMVAELLDQIVKDFPDSLSQELPSEGEDGEIHVAIVGRPNVGKSSLLNALLGQSRVVVDATPGTTRDSIDTQLHFEKRAFLLIDTAGMRRRSQKGGHLEKLTILQASRAIDRADICMLVLSVEEGLSKQDAHIAGYIEEQGKGLMILWNKMDLAKAKDCESLEQTVRNDMPFLSKVPLHFVSAKEGWRIDRLLPGAIELYTELGKEIPTSKINKVFADLVTHHSMPLYKGREVKLYYATQVGTHPPLFVIFSNLPQGVPESYRRYLVHGLQARLGMEHIPLRVVFRKR